MAWLSVISVRLKLALVAAIVVLGTFVVAAVATFALGRTIETTRSLAQTDIVVLRELGETRAGVGNMRRFEKDMFINLGDEKDLDKYHKSWRAEVAAAMQHLEKSQPLLVAEERAGVERLTAGIRGYASAMEAIVGDIRAGKIHDPWAANKALEPSKGSIRAADKAFEEINGSVEKRVHGREASLAAMEKQTVGVVLGTTALVIGVTIFLAWVVAHRITRPLEDAMVAVERVAAGDLTHSVQASGRDETARVLHGVAQMQRALCSMVAELRAGVESVSTASHEIATGNSDLSARTEHQASSLQQTAASMEQLTGTVSMTAQSARSANDRARQVSSVAERSGSEVRAVMDTMAEIEQSSRRIAEIIGIIDGIAFQTNILALNAAVEAARAGDQGRGFAVVASEVRALAQRSAEAAQQIKALIGESVSRVEAGSGLVKKAGATIAQVVSEVQGVNELIAHISQATGEQGQGISVIGQSVSQLDEVTQKNAALVEQTAAASESLRDQARRLSDLVGRFRVAPGQPA